MADPTNQLQPTPQIADILNRPGRINPDGTKSCLERGKNDQVMRRHLLISLLLVIAVFVAFGQVANHGFINYDDDQYVTENPHVQAGLTAEGVAWAFTTFHASNWHPLTWLSLMADANIYALNPQKLSATGFHLTNLLLHLINVLLLFYLLRRMTGSTWRSALVAAVFAVHPLHVESVAWVAERKDVLSTLFWLLTIWAYVRYSERPAMGRYLPVGLMLVLGLMAKPMLVTLPVVLLMLDYWPLNRFKSMGIRRLVWEKLPLSGVALVSSVVTFVAQKQGGAVGSFEHLTAGVRVANSVVAYTTYIGKTIYPHSMAVPYPHPGGKLPVWETAACALILTALSAVALRAARRRPYLIVGWAWFVVTLVPVIGLIQVGSQAMADRYTYISMIGLSIAAAWGVPEMLRCEWYPLRRAFALGGAAVMVAALMVCTRTQVGYWSDSTTLFRHSLACTRGNYMAHNNLGVALAEQGKTDEAAAQYRASLAIEPSYGDANNNLGNILVQTCRVREAIPHFDRALSADPKAHQVHNNLGVALAKLGELDRAAAHFEAALRLDPGYKSAKTNLNYVKKLMRDRR